MPVLIARMLIDHMLIAYGLAELVRIAPNVPAARVAGKLALAQDNLGGEILLSLLTALAHQHLSHQHKEKA